MSECCLLVSEYKSGDFSILVIQYGFLCPLIMSNWEDYLRRLYYDPGQPSSYTSPEKLYQTIKKEGKFKISRGKLKTWLQGQETYTMHRYARHKFPRSKIIAAGIDDIWDADLMIMDRVSKYNSGFSNVLLMIDIFSRYVWVRPLKSKKAKEVLEAIQSIFAEGRKPNYLRTDQGGEFTNLKAKKFFKQQGIIHILTYDPNKSAYAERAIQTLKNRIFRYMSKEQSYRYVDVLQDLVKSYNATYHRSIRKSPDEVNKDNEWQIFQLQYHPKKPVNTPVVKKEKKKKKGYFQIQSG